MHASSRVPNWKLLNHMELMAFLGLLIISGAMFTRNLAVRHTWNAKCGSHIFKATMSRKRSSHLIPYVRLEAEQIIIQERNKGNKFAQRAPSSNMSLTFQFMCREFDHCTLPRILDYLQYKAEARLEPLLIEPNAAFLIISSKWRSSDKVKNEIEMFDKFYAEEKERLFIPPTVAVEEKQFRLGVKETKHIAVSQKCVFTNDSEIFAHQCE